MQGSTARLAGLASVFAGLAVFVCRYTLLPLDLSSLTGSVLIALGATLVVTGGRLLRGARSAGAAGPAGLAGTAGRIGSLDAPLERGTAPEPVVAPTATSAPSGPRVSALAVGAAVVVPVVAVVGAFLALRPAPPESRLRPVDLPGLRVSLPAWHVGFSESEWFSGRHRLDDPAGLNRFVEVRWSVGDAPPDELMRQLLVQEGMEVRSERTERVCGQRARTLQLDATGGGKESWFTWWHAEGRNDSLLSFVHSRTGDVRKVHEAILASVRCSPAPADVGRPTFPVVDTPPGFQRSESTDTLALEAPDGAAMALVPGQAGHQLRDDLVQASSVRLRVLATVVQLPLAAVSLEPTASRRTAADGTSQDVWQGEVRPPDEPPLLALFGVWVCPAPERSFLGLYLGPAGESPERGLALLGSARCP